MLNRKALILGYPGEIGDEHYCEGVIHDLEGYKHYFGSIHGGAWDIDSEVFTELNITKSKLSEYSDYFKREADYSVIVFAGHGEYDTRFQQTRMQINRISSILVNDIKGWTNRQLLIMDCCRKRTQVFIKSRIQDSMTIESFSNNRDIYRSRFNELLEKSVEDTIEIYGCSIDEFSQDISNRGGLFSYQLLNSAKGDETLSIYKTFAKAQQIVQELSKNKQTPVIHRPRSGITFPFYIT